MASLIQSFQLNNYYKEIPLNGARYKGRETAPAIEIIRAHHLDAFLGDDDND